MKVAVGRIRRRPLLPFCAKDIGLPFFAPLIWLKIGLISANCIMWRPGLFPFGLLFLAFPHPRRRINLAKSPHRRLRAQNRAIMHAVFPYFRLIDLAKCAPCPHAGAVYAHRECLLR